MWWPARLLGASSQPILAVPPRERNDLGDASSPSARGGGLRRSTPRARGVAHGPGRRRRGPRTLLPRRRGGGHRQDPPGGGAGARGGGAGSPRALGAVLGERRRSALLALDSGDPGLSPDRSLGGPAPRRGRGRRAIPRAARPGAGRGTVAGAVRPAAVGARALLSLRCGGPLPRESPRPDAARPPLRRPALGRHPLAAPAAT